MFELNLPMVALFIPVSFSSGAINTPVTIDFIMS